MRKKLKTALKLTLGGFALLNLYASSLITVGYDIAGLNIHQWLTDHGLSGNVGKIAAALGGYIVPLSLFYVIVLALLIIREDRDK